jgi:hypothetical protein
VSEVDAELAGAAVDQGPQAALEACSVGLLREIGLPARYVSGYLHPQPEAQPGDEMAGESHGICDGAHSSTMDVTVTVARLA